jgi:protein O-GlcNAc transferase
MRLKFQKALNFFQKGQLVQAEKLCTEIEKENSKDINNLNLLSIILFKKKKFNDAIKIIQKSLKINPNQAESNNNLGLMLMNKSNINEAIYCFTKAIELKKNFADAYNNLGIAYKDLGNLDSAINSWKKLIEIQPTSFQAYNNIGNIYLEDNKNILAIKYYDKAITLEKNFYLAYFNRGNALQNLGKLNASLDSFSEAIKLNPKYSDAYYNRGNSFKLMGKLNYALNDYVFAYKLNPSLKNLFGNIFDTKNNLCDWENYNESLSYLKKQINDNKNVMSPFTSLSVFNSTKIQNKVAKIHLSSDFGNKFKNKNINFFNENKDNKKIKIGYFSSDFKKHAMSHLLSGMFEVHDKSNFEVYGFLLTQIEKDEMTNRIANSFDHFIDVSNKTNKEISELSRSLKIDIAIDLMGYTKSNRFEIFLEKCAPIQINYLGYSATSGSRMLDYIIADKTLINDDNKNDYSEKIIYMPDTFMPNNFKDIKLKKDLKRKDFGLSENSFVFCCFNKQYKFTPYIFDVWMDLLNRIEKSSLWLLVNNNQTIKNLKKEALKRNINPNRLIFAQGLPLQQHLSRHVMADLFLDTFPYGAHTTCGDSLWSGLPVLTLKGNTFASRVSSSLLNAINLNELIANSVDEYKSIAIDLAKNPQKLYAIKRKLIINKNKSPLFDTKNYTKNLEAAYKLIYKRNNEKKPVADVTI